MGIPGLWDILGDGEVTPIAELSTEHFKRTGRPLRVAIDEAGWRFNNLSDQQVAIIRQKVPEANPIEKAILWRVLRLMRLNIQPIFIFDGPSRPWKRGGVAGRIDWRKIDLLRKTLDVLKIPHHRAPAEAEAECARLNELGIVDAVWSDDGDTLMFGGKILIRDYREGGGKSAKKSDTHVRVYRNEVIARKHRIDRQGLILFALLSGGDYDTKGLEGCGARAALAAARFDNGRLGQILYETPLGQLHAFTESLREYFLNRGVFVPPGYPRKLHVKNYREPKVSTPEQANDLRALKKGWDLPINEAKLRPFLLEKFDFQTKEYIKHILPVLLNKALAHTAPDRVQDNLVFNIEMMYKRGQDPHAPTLERKIIFSPLVATDLNLKVQPSNENWEKYTNKDGAIFDPTLPLEAEFLDCVLETGLGSTEMQRLKEAATQPKPRKRKAQEVAADEPTTSTTTEPDAFQQPESSVTAAKKPRKNAKDTTTKPATKRKTKKQKEAEAEAEAAAAAAAAEPPPPPKQFRLPTVLQRYGSLPELVGEDSFGSDTSVAPMSRQSSFRSAEQTSQDTQAQATQPRSNQSNQRAPPSSQAHPEAGSWPSPQVTTSSAQRSAKGKAPATQSQFAESASARPSAAPAHNAAGDTFGAILTMAGAVHHQQQQEATRLKTALVLTLLSDSEDDDKDVSGFGGTYHGKYAHNIQAPARQSQPAQPFGGPHRQPEARQAQDAARDDVIFAQSKRPRPASKNRAPHQQPQTAPHATAPRHQPQSAESRADHEDDIIFGQVGPARPAPNAKTPRQQPRPAPNTTAPRPQPQSAGAQPNSADDIFLGPSILGPSSRQLPSYNIRPPHRQSQAAEVPTPLLDYGVFAPPSPTLLKIREEADSSDLATNIQGLRKLKRYKSPPGRQRIGTEIRADMTRLIALDELASLESLSGTALARAETVSRPSASATSRATPAVPVSVSERESGPEVSYATAVSEEVRGRREIAAARIKHFERVAADNAAVSSEVGSTVQNTAVRNTLGQNGNGARKPLPQTIDLTLDDD